MMKTKARTVTCTPHFKEDADSPWITQEGVDDLSLWMSPNSDMTLDDIAELVEQFGVENAVAEEPCAQMMRLRYSVFFATIPRGGVIGRDLQKRYRAQDVLHDGEPFTFMYAFTASARPPLWLMVLCPCCLPCYFCKRSCWTYK